MTELPLLRRFLALLIVLVFPIQFLGCGGSKVAAASAFGPSDATMRTPAPAPEEPSPATPEAAAATASEPTEDRQLSAENSGALTVEAPASRPAKVAQAGAPHAAGPATKKENSNGEPEPPGAPPVATDAPRMNGPLMIYKATLNIGAFDVLKSLNQIQELAKTLNGYLVNRSDLEITIRIPADRFEYALSEVLKSGDVLHRNVSVQDVTKDYYDLQIRLRNAESVLERLTQLLKRADKVEDALSVERELQRVAGEVEQMKGQLRLLRELIAFSTITVQFEARSVERVGNKVRLPFPWLQNLGLGNLLNL